MSRSENELLDYRGFGFETKYDYQHKPVERQSGVRDRRQRRHRHGHHQETVGLGPRRRGHRQADRTFAGEYNVLNVCELLKTPKTREP